MTYTSLHFFNSKGRSDDNLTCPTSLVQWLCWPSLLKRIKVTMQQTVTSLGGLRRSTSPSELNSSKRLLAWSLFSLNTTTQQKR